MRIFPGFGSGPSNLSGKPALFIQFLNCDIECVWCPVNFSINDHIATVQKAFFEIYGKYKAIDRLVITGGNPFSSANIDTLASITIKTRKSHKLYLTHTGDITDIGKETAILKSLKNSVSHLIMSVRPPSAKVKYVDLERISSFMFEAILADSRVDLVCPFVTYADILYFENAIESNILRYYENLYLFSVTGQFDDFSSEVLRFLTNHNGRLLYQQSLSYHICFL